MTSKKNFLKKVPLFADLDDEALEVVANMSEALSFEKGAVIAYQRDVADSLYILRDGRLFISAVDERGIVRETRSLLPGDILGERWLFTEEAYPFTVRAAGDGRVLRIKGEDFRTFLETFPEIVGALALSPEGREAAAKSRLVTSRPEFRAVSLLADELVEYWSRRTPYLLIFRAGLPAIFAFGLLGIWGWLLYLNRSGQDAVSTLTLGFVLFVAFLAFLIVAFQILDWYNDYFLITNKQIVHHEFSLRTFRTRNNKIPLDQVQSVEILKPNLLASILNVGTAKITTAAFTGLVLFDYIDDPTIVEATIRRLTQQVRSLDAARAQETLRQTVEEHFNVAPAFAEDAADEDAASYVPPPVRSPTIFTRFVRAFGSRYQEGATIVYRKHILVLITAVWWQALVMLLVSALATWVLVSGSPARTFLCGLLFLFGAPIGAWLIWRFEDWRNEMFQLTELYVVDVDRLPFGFGESRKQAELTNVQNVNAVRPSIWATLFNYGNVEIEVAGTDANIVFETVVNPEEVQSDIFRRREQVRQRAQIRDGYERRKEYALLLDVYQQANEQGRIPRRTPDPSLAELAATDEEDDESDAGDLLDF